MRGRKKIWIKWNWTATLFSCNFFYSPWNSLGQNKAQVVTRSYYFSHINKIFPLVAVWVGREQFGVFLWEPGPLHSEVQNVERIQGQEGEEGLAVCSLFLTRAAGPSVSTDPQDGEVVASVGSDERGGCRGARGSLLAVPWFQEQPGEGEGRRAPVLLKQTEQVSSIRTVGHGLRVFPFPYMQGLKIRGHSVCTHCCWSGVFCETGRGRKGYRKKHVVYFFWYRHVSGVHRQFYLILLLNIRCVVLITNQKSLCPFLTAWYRNK